MTKRTRSTDEPAAICCGEKSAVLDSRPNTGGSWRRRRKCVVCGRRWTTIEITHASMPAGDVDIMLSHLRRIMAEVDGLVEYLERELPHRGNRRADVDHQGAADHGPA